tara:strand:+ start:452 stop:1390 length:939 start_codon:yes stop_codon:yes gene_type:complete
MKSKNKLFIFGSSKIVHHHIRAAKKNKFQIIGISTLSNKKTNIKRIAYKFKIKNYFNNLDSAKIFIKRNIGLNILISGRIIDNFKIINNVGSYAHKIILEKPIETKIINFKRYSKFSKKIFVGYNRIYYSNINLIKKKIKQNLFNNVVCICPEKNLTEINKNTCHIISVLFYLFGKLKITNIVINNDAIYCVLRNKKTMIQLNIMFNASTNYSINFFYEKLNFQLKPIENLKIYKGIKIKKNNGKKIYEPSLIKNLYENNNLFKEGFINQYKNFKLFCQNKKCDYVNLDNAKLISGVCDLITKKYLKYEKNL